MAIFCPVQKLDVPAITAEVIHADIQSGKDAILLDVRTREEHCDGHIVGSIHCPYTEIRTKVEKIVPDKSTLVYVYCASGSRSSFAARDLLALGYKNIFNMTGGIMDWVGRGYELKSG